MLQHTEKSRAEATFNSAIQRPASEREAYLASVCGSDTVLMADVRELLDAHEAAGDFLRSEISLAPEIEAELSRLKPEKEGDHIGRYKLQQEIGVGGFGTVWMAEQVEPVSRRVALKIIKMGMDTREVIARFEQERQALAMMDHPNIARVFDAGATQVGRPFFVMELVKGIPITQFCDERQLGTRERLALFGDVCSAINHAHQKGVIHRDIKPSNVMVTLHGEKAVVKIIDFGIAKATQGRLTDKTLFTRFEQFVGTPVYMSPEQATLSGLDIDTRSDIYALGILLYELLTGKPPFDARTLASAGYEEMRRIIREEEPPKPSSRLSTIAGDERTALAKAHQVDPTHLNRIVEPDLDWIVMKAIDKDRSRRYETANGLAMDIQRFLADEPVSATPPSAAYKFRKFAKRNKTTLRVMAGIAAVLVAATAVSTWQAVRATKAEKLSAYRLAQVAAERDAKEQARKDAEAISRFLSEVFESPNPSRSGRTVTVVEILDKAAKKLETDLARQPAHRALLQGTLGTTYVALGLPRQAIPLHEKERDYFFAAYGLENPRTLMAMSTVARSYAAAGRLKEALEIQEEVLPLSRKVNGPEHPSTLGAMTNLALSYAAVGRPNEALELQEEVVPLSRKVNGLENSGTLGAMANLAISYAAAGRQQEALALRTEVLPLIRKVKGPEHPGTINAMSNLAFSYFDTGRKDEALKMREEVLALCRKVLGNEHPDTINSAASLSVSYSAAGRQDEVIKLWEEIVQLRRNVNGPDHVETTKAMQFLAGSYLRAGRTLDALPLLDATSIGNPAGTYEALQLGALQVWLGQYVEHRATSRRMLKWAADTEDPLTADRVSKLVCLHEIVSPEMLEPTLALARRAVELGKAHEYLGYFQLALGMAEYRCEHLDASGAALETASKAAAGNPYVQLPAAYFRVMLLSKQGKEAEARQLFDQTAKKMKPLPADGLKPMAGEIRADDLIVWIAFKEAKMVLDPPQLE